MPRYSANAWENFKGISAEGADLFGVGNAYAPEEVANDVQSMVQTADEISTRDGVPWFISEFLVFTQDDAKLFQSLADMELQLEFPYEEYYRAGLNAFNDNAKNPAGFSFMSWTGTGMVRATGAVPLLKEFFAGMK